MELKSKTKQLKYFQNKSVRTDGKFQTLFHHLLFDKLLTYFRGGVQDPALLALEIGCLENRNWK